MAPPVSGFQHLDHPRIRDRVGDVELNPAAGPRFRDFYSNEIGWKKLAEDIQEPLKKALKELPNTKL